MSDAATVYLVSDDEEFWGNGETFATREAAIAYGMEEYEPGDSFWTGIQGPRPMPAIDTNNLESLFEQKEEEYERPSELDHWPDATPAQMKELAQEMSTILQAWLGRHDLMPKWWPVEKTQQHQVPEVQP